MKPLIFLDIDGVLNDWGFGRIEGQYTAMISPKCVAHFNRLVAQTGADVVLSSSWRYMVLKGSMTVQGFGQMLLTHRVRCNLIDTTRIDLHREDICDPKDPEDLRAYQVEDWLQSNGRRPYVVLDDDDDGMTEMGHPFVHIVGKHGLTEMDVVKAIDLLRGQQ